MKYLSIFTLLYLLANFPAIAQINPDSVHFVEQIVQDDDTLLFKSIPEVEVINKGKFRSSDERRKFYRLKRNILKVYPYAMYAVDLYNEIQDETGDLRRRKRKKYIKEREEVVREKFEEDVRNFTKSQGHLFVDIINRETGGDCYQVIKEVKSGFIAFNWQRIGLLFGYNLRETYDPEAPENADIELIISMIQNNQPGYLTKVLH